MTTMAKGLQLFTPREQLGGASVLVLRVVEGILGIAAFLIATCENVGVTLTLLGLFAFSG